MAHGAVTANHYQTLGVAPAAEDAVIRAAYRALMRRYHPDANPDPGSQARAREITAAFSVLGNPARRAAYDALPRPADDLWSGNRPWLEEGQRGPPPMRAVGLAAVALALALSVSVALWPTQTAPPTSPLAAPPSPSVQPPQPDRAVDMPSEPVGGADPAASVPIAAIPEAPEPDLPQARVSAVPPSQLPRQPAPPRLRQVAQRAAQPVIAPAPATRTRPESRAKRPAAVAQISRPAEVERMAVGFHKQSLAHADWSKQQLLLSAQIRSRTSRNLCRSADCVTKVYLRQMQETTAIMEGRIPGQ